MVNNRFNFYRYMQRTTRFNTFSACLFITPSRSLLKSWTNWSFPLCLKKPKKAGKDLHITKLANKNGNNCNNIAVIALINCFQYAWVILIELMKLNLLSSVINWGFVSLQLLQSIRAASQSRIFWESNIHFIP